MDASLKPHPGAEEVRVCQSPIRFKLDGNKLTVINERNNASTADLKFRWEMTDNGKVVKSGVLDVPVTECFESAVVEVPVDAPNANDWCFLNVFCDAPTHEITRVQFALSAPAQASSAISKLQATRPAT